MEKNEDRKKTDTCKHGLTRSQCVFCLEAEKKSKVCTKCGETKAIDQFSKGVGTFGKRGICKPCVSAYHEKYFEKKRKGRAKAEVAPPQERGLKQRKEHGVADGIAPGSAVLSKVILKGLAEKAHQEDALNPPDLELAKNKADEHWDYIKALLTAHLGELPDLSIIEFHYKSAFAHGWKHGMSGQ